VLRADPVELSLYVEIAKRAAEFQKQRDQSLARMVVNELAAAMRRSR